MTSSDQKIVDYKIKVETSLQLHAFSTQLIEIFKHAAVELPKLLPDVYKKITIEAKDPIVFKVEYAEGCPIKTEIDRIEKIDEKTSTFTYSVIGGDLLDYYKSFNVNMVLTPVPLPGGGTKIKQTYEFVKETARTGPAFLEFDIAKLIELDLVLNKH